MSKNKKARLQLDCLYGFTISFKARKPWICATYMCDGISYSHVNVTQLCSQIANEMILNINEYGVHVPNWIVKGKVSSFGGLCWQERWKRQLSCNGYVYQRRSIGDLGSLCKPFTFPEYLHQIRRLQYNWKRKPQITDSSPFYETFKLGSRDQYLEESEQNDTAWLIARSMSRAHQLKRYDAIAFRCNKCNLSWEHRRRRWQYGNVWLRRRYIFR